MKKTTARPIGFTLDSGALIALERGDLHVRRLLDDAKRGELPVALPAPVLAQVWRDTPRQAEIARRLLRGRGHVEIVSLDKPAALKVGKAIGVCGHPDVVDVHVGVVARERGHTVLTSDAGDIAKVDPGIRIVRVSASVRR